MQHKRRKQNIFNIRVRIKPKSDIVNLFRNIDQLNEFFDYNLNKNQKFKLKQKKKMNIFINKFDEENS